MQGNQKTKAIELAEKLECDFKNDSPDYDNIIEAAAELRRLSALEQQGEAVAWSVLDKRTGKHWFTHESKSTAQHYANEYSHRESDGSSSMVVKPLYTYPTADLTDEQIDALADEHADGGFAQVGHAMEFCHFERESLLAFARAIIAKVKGV